MPSAGGADGVFEVDPAAMSAVLLETDTGAFVDLAYPDDPGSADAAMSYAARTSAVKPTPAQGR